MIDPPTNYHADAERARIIAVLREEMARWRDREVELSGTQDVGAICGAINAQRALKQAIDKIQQAQ